MQFVVERRGAVDGYRQFCQSSHSVHSMRRRRPRSCFRIQHEAINCPTPGAPGGPVLIVRLLQCAETPIARARRCFQAALLNHRLLRTGCQWRLLPREFPVWGTVYHCFRSWKTFAEQNAFVTCPLFAVTKQLAGNAGDARKCPFHRALGDAGHYVSVLRDVKIVIEVYEFKVATGK